MISRKYINELSNFIGQNVSVCGFVNTVRNQGGIKFILLRDNTGYIQCVVLKSNTNAFELAGNLFNESVIKVSGLLKEEKQAPGGFEILAEEIEVLSLSDAELPIPVNQDKIIDDVEVSKRMDFRWLDSYGYCWFSPTRIRQYIAQYTVKTELEKTRAKPSKVTI